MLMKSEPTSIKEKWLQPRKDEVDPFPPIEDGPDEVMDEGSKRDAELASIQTRFEEGTLVTKQDAGQAKSSHLQDVYAFENAAKTGLVKSSTGNKWMPIKSGEGRGPDKNMSYFEIGHGIKVEEAWLGDDQSKWPTVKGVKVNVKEGMTEDQESWMVQDLLDKSYGYAQKAIKGWDTLTENAKVFWGDLTYNGGRAAIDKNPKAKAAVEKGFVVEGMINALDFIGSGGKPSRGLLNRRITMYNKAASEITGAPIIEEYSFGDDIKVRFAHGFMTDKVSNGFKTKQGEDLWRTILSQKGKYDGKEITMKMDQDQKFRG